MNEPPVSITPVDLPVVFILAKGRSGTTLLQTMLDAHPNVIAPLESRFVVHYKHRYGKITKWTPKRKDQFYQDILKEQKISLFWDLDKELLKSRLDLLPEDCSYGDLCQQVYASCRSFFEKGNPSVIIDKNPIHSVLIPLIREVFPNARFIHMIRDYRACTSSTLRLQSRKSLRELGLRWLMANNEVSALKNELPEKVITIRYEDLISDAQSQLERLTNFLGVDYSVKMLSYHETISDAYKKYIEEAPNERAQKLREQGADSVHKNLGRPLDPSIVSGWKHRLSAEQIERLDAFCSNYGVNYDYQPVGVIGEPQDIPKDINWIKTKLQLYYRLPIWLRELKAKPNLALMNEQ